MGEHKSSNEQLLLAVRQIQQDMAALSDSKLCCVRLVVALRSANGVNSHHCVNQVCMDQPVSVVLLPCRHHTLCKECANAVRRCPMCRSAITERMVVFD